MEVQNGTTIPYIIIGGRIYLTMERRFDFGCLPLKPPQMYHIPMLVMLLLHPRLSKRELLGKVLNTGKT